MLKQPMVGLDASEKQIELKRISLKLEMLCDAKGFALEELPDNLFKFHPNEKVWLNKLLDDFAALSDYEGSRAQSPIKDRKILNLDDFR